MSDAALSSPSFMAAPGQVADWRLVLVYDAARASGLLDALPATVEAAATACGLAPTAVRVVLDALIAAGIAGRHSDGTVVLTDRAPDADAAVQLQQHANAIRRWSGAIDARLRGEQDDAGGPFQLQPWLESMAVNAARHAEPIAALALGCVTRTGPRRGLDLGGGHGRYAAALAARGVAMTMQDRADVIAVVEAQGWLAGTGVTTVVGDFHETLPEGPFDIVLAVGIMHTMAPERAAALVRRVGQRMRPGAVLVIRTMLRNDGPASALFAVQMLISAHGGDTHRFEDYCAWLAAAGLTDPERHDVDNGTVLLSTKP